MRDGERLGLGPRVRSARISALTTAGRAGPIPFPLKVSVKRLEATLSAQLRSTEYGEAVATEVVAGADRFFITAATFQAPLTGRAVQLSLVVTGDRVTGTWTAGTGQSGTIEGRKL